MQSKRTQYNSNINKIQDDETLISEFSTYIALALHHAKLYDKLRKSENSVAVINEVKAYHAQASQNEVDLILAEGRPKEDEHQDISTQM